MVAQASSQKLSLSLSLSLPVSFSDGSAGGRLEGTTRKGERTDKRESRLDYGKCGCRVYNRTIETASANDKETVMYVSWTKGEAEREYRRHKRRRRNVTKRDERETEEGSRKTYTAEADTSSASLLAFLEGGRRTSKSRRLLSDTRSILLSGLNSLSSSRNTFWPLFPRVKPLFLSRHRRFSTALY